jgi:hypothetical protein
MKTKILFLIFSLFTAVAWADSFDLGSHGTLNLVVPETWSVEGHDIKGMGYDLEFHVKKSAKTAIQVTLLYSSKDTPRDEKSTEAEFTRNCGQFARASVEKKVAIKKMELKAGFGYYATFTDESLVGKPFVPGNFKTMTPGMMVLPPDVVASVTIFAEDTGSQAFTQAVTMIQSTTLTPSPNPPATAPPGK